jgi:hypothetical protein
VTPAERRAGLGEILRVDRGQIGADLNPAAQGERDGAHGALLDELTRLDLPLEPPVAANGAAGLAGPGVVGLGGVAAGRADEAQHLVGAGAQGVGVFAEGPALAAVEALGGVALATHEV